MLRGPLGKLGQVIDISKGGLAFRYIDIGERPGRSLDLDITIKNNGFHLENIRFESLSDIKATKQFPFSSTKMRRRGGKFSQLNHEQLSHLEYFIQNYTTGKA